VPLQERYNKVVETPTPTHPLPAAGLWGYAPDPISDFKKNKTEKIAFEL
jgi:hypothetical protein